MSVRILNGALDEHEGRIVLRGALDPASLKELKVDDYQRAVAPVTSLRRIMKGFDAGSAVPDVELGMRGSKKTFRDGVYTLHDDVYTIDGLQRISAAGLYLADGKTPHLGATIHFNTTQEWERKQFKILNADRVRVSSNVIIRNFKEDYDGVKGLYNMSLDDREFVMRGKIGWDQALSRAQLISCSTFVKVVLAIHAHLNECSGFTAPPEDLCIRIQKVVETIGKQTFRANVRHFFDVIDQAWHVRNVAFKEKTPFIRATFLLTLAKVLSNHEVFWRESRLLVDADFRRKIGSFPIFDNAVINMVSTGTRVDRELYRYLVEHINKGKRHRRLSERQPIESSPEEPASTDEAATG